MNLEDEARKFSAAAKKQRQRDNKRRGIKLRSIKVTDEIAIPSLVVGGLLAEKDMRDDEAINAALAEHLTRSFSRSLILRDRARSSSGVQLLSPREEMKRYCRQQEQTSEEMVEYKRKEKERARRLLEGGTASRWGTPPSPRGASRWGTAPSPPGASSGPRGGNARGRNPGLLTAQVVIRGKPRGSYQSKPLPGSSSKRIGQLKLGELNKREKALGVSKDKDSDPHFVQLDAGEVEQKLDRHEAEDEGISTASPPAPNLDEQ
jgi:hypothetical protein